MTVRCALLVLAIPAASARAQETRGATVAGTVRDSMAQPIPEADIVVRPGNARTRSDSTGRFFLTGLDGGGYVVYARKLGYSVERWDVKLSSGGRVELKFILQHQPRRLDTVSVTAAATCPAFSLEGFECRRRSRNGVFLDYPDIDERGTTYTADLFRDIPGFRTTLVSRFGSIVPVGVRNNGGCIAALVDGREATRANPVPTYSRDLSGMEVYAKPDSVPSEYQRYTWATDDATRTGRCSVIVYWTIWAPVTR